MYLDESWYRYQRSPKTPVEAWWNVPYVTEVTVVTDTSVPTREETLAEISGDIEEVLSNIDGSLQELNVLMKELKLVTQDEVDDDELAVSQIL